ncbi:Protein trichome birefringence-like 16 [Ancistrocladus abbreviatus]
MKGVVYVPRGARLPFIFVILICATILMLGWEKTPFLTAILQRPSRLFQLSPDVLVGSPLPSVPSERQILMHENRSTFTRNETLEKHKGQAVDTAMRLGSKKETKASSEGTSASRGGRSSSEERVDFAVPAISENTSSRVSMKDEGNLTNQVNNRTCNYAKGKWVADDRRPFYSGSGCKKWLSEMWACRMTQRADFSYEKFRWQPLDCEMKEFEGSKFLERLQDKTLAFIGDSLARQQFQSLMCMITGGEERPDVMNVGWEFGLVKARGAKRPDGWAYRFPSTNTTVLFYWSACLCDLVPLNVSEPTTQVAMHLDRAPWFLQRYLDKFDVLVLNTGHHWNRGKLNANRWVMHVGGVPNTDSKLMDIGRAKNFTIHNIVKWVDSQLPKHPKLKAFYRSISPRHFFNGDWNTGGTCDGTIPLSKGKEVAQDESKDPAPASAVKGTNVTFLDITALSELRDEAHLSRYTIRPTPGMEDCLHWCLPGVPDTWNEILFAQL